MMKLGAMKKLLKIAGAIPFTLDIPQKKVIIPDYITMPGCLANPPSKLSSAFCPIHRKGSFRCITCQNALIHTEGQQARSICRFTEDPLMG